MLNVITKGIWRRPTRTRRGDAHPSPRSAVAGTFSLDYPLLARFGGRGRAGLGGLQRGFAHSTGSLDRNT